MREVVYVAVVAAAVAAGCKKSEAPKQSEVKPAPAEVGTPSAAGAGSQAGTTAVAKQAPPPPEEASQEELARLKDKRLAGLSDTVAPPEFTQDNVPVGMKVDDLKKRYRCKLQRSSDVEFGPLNFVPTLEAVFPIVGGFHMGYRKNLMEYQSLKPGIVTSSAKCEALTGDKFYGVYAKKSDGTVIGIQKYISLKGAPQQIFDTAYESMRQKCKGRMSEPVRGTWVVDRKERFAGICDEGALRTIVTTNPVFPLSAIITYVDLASWKSEMDEDARGVTNTKADVEKLSGRL
jgi:hypothetical protein